MVIVVAQKCFGEGHTVTVIAKKTPWALLRNMPFEAINAPKRVMQIVRDFEKTDKYIV